MMQFAQPSEYRKGQIYNTKGISWHGKVGIDVSDCESSEEVIKKAKLDFEVAKCPISAKMPINEYNFERNDGDFINGNFYYEVEDNFATFRTDKLIPLGFVRSRYEVVQNIKAFEFFDRAIGDDIQFDRAGYFGYGHKMFISAKITKPTIVNDRDIVDNYLILTNSHDGKEGVNIIISPIRMICLNQLHSLSKFKEITIKHNTGANSQLDVLPKVLGLVKQELEKGEEVFRKMHEVKIDTKFLKGIICKTILSEEELANPNFETDNFINDLFARDMKAVNKSNISTRKLNTMIEIYDYSCNGIGQQEIKNSAWGVLNGITGYYSNVKEFNDGKTRMHNLIWGTESRYIERATKMIQYEINR
jgi:phage/plasmid-like protein (TIGR03299 family)